MFTDPKALQILKEEEAKMDAFFTAMDAKIKNAQDNTVDEQIWTTPNQRRLIAAAPELLDELKTQADQWDDVIEIMASNPTWDKARLMDWLTKKSTRNARTARAAILKADG